MKKMNKILKAFMMFGIVGIISIVFTSNSLAKINDSEEYYQKLSGECNSSSDKTCCLDSLEQMKKDGGYKMPSSGVCDYGYKREMMNCESSFEWCKPATINETNINDFYKSLKDKCETNGNKKCCLESVKRMEAVGATHLAHSSKDISENDCKKGEKYMTLRCPGSYAWCQKDNVVFPSKVDESEKITEIQLTQKQLREKRILLINELRKQIQRLKEKIQKILADRIESLTQKNINFTKKLHIGSTDRYTNNEVTKLQKFLISENVYPEKLVTGYYGKLTSRAVKRLKEKYEINVYPGVEWSPKIYEKILDSGKNLGSGYDNEGNSTICTLDAKKCPDGTFVGRIGPKCEFAKCPGEKIDNDSLVCGTYYNNGCISTPFGCTYGRPAPITKTFLNIKELKKVGGKLLYAGRCHEDGAIQNFISIELPTNTMTEKECALKGGEVWNTLGQTSYNGELIGKIEGLRCPCACLVRSEGSDTLWVTKNGNKEEFTGNLSDIKTFDDCKEAGFKIIKGNPDICQVGEPYMTGGKYKTFSNNLMEAGKTCTDYTHSTCPGSCVATCTPSFCSDPDENGVVACTSDCDGPKSCVAR